MIRMVQKHLIIPRGDTGTFSIPVLTTSNTGDASVFTIFDPKAHRKVFEKQMTLSEGTLTMNFTHADTVNLPVGQYVWDIKFYKNALIVDGVFENGDEVDSYYAAFKLPLCEIRETGDTLLTAEDAPDSLVKPSQLNIILGAVSGIHDDREVAEDSAQTATEAAATATDKAEDAADSAAAAADTLQEMRDLLPTIPTKTSDLENDSGFITEHQSLEFIAPYDTDPFEDYHNIGDLFIVDGQLYRALENIAPNDTLYLNHNVEVVSLVDNLSDKADKKDTVLTSTLSRGRAANSTVGAESMAFGYQVTASGLQSIALGSQTVASGNESMAVNRDSVASGRFSFAEGFQTQASGSAAHSEGQLTVASGSQSHAGGTYAQAQGNKSFSYGYYTIAPYNQSVAFGYNNYVNSNDDGENFSYNKHYNIGDIVISATSSYICIQENNGSKVPSDDKENWKRYTSNGKAAFYIGNGLVSGQTSTPSNALKVDWDGNLYLNGETYVNCNADSTGGSKLATVGEIPTKVSDLTDDSGHYIKPVNGIPASDLEETYLTQHQDISGKADISSLAAVATSGDYNDLSNKPTIPVVPTNVSDFTNDAGYLTSHQDISGKANSADLATVATSGDYDDLLNKPTIPTVPTNVSVFTNDAGYLTSHQDISGKVDKVAGKGLSTNDFTDAYKTKLDSALTSFTETDPTVPSWAKAAQKPTYTAAEVGATTSQDVSDMISTAIGNIHQFDIEIVQELPTTNIKEHTVYFVPKTGETNDVYDEYIRVNNDWEMIGNTQIDLSNYATKSEIPSIPTNISAFTNDAGYLTQHQDISGKANTTDLATVAFSGSYNDLQNKPSIPTKVSDLTDDSGHYTKPTGGIPASDLADTYLTSHQSLTNYVQKTDYAAPGIAGLTQAGNGLTVAGHGELSINPAAATEIKTGTETSKPIAPARQHEAVFYGLAKAAGDTTQKNSDNAVGTYTASAKSAILTMIGADIGVAEETVSGTTPTITAATNTRYICGEVSTISITPCATGSCEIIFTSGTTPAVLTLPNTVKLPDWFDATSLETNRIYDILITNGAYGAVMSWAS